MHMPLVQLIPPTFEVTVPEVMTVPVILTISVNVCFPTPVTLRVAVPPGVAETENTVDLVPNAVGVNLIS
jgi:hypothetical protein